MRLGFGIEIGDSQFGTSGAEGFCTAPGNTVFIGNADDQAFQALKRGVREV